MAYSITADYHTHTKYSHGKGSIQDNVLVALSKGLKRIAITDHGFRHIGFGMSLKDIDRIREEIDDMNSRYPSIEVLMGVEANLIGINGEIDIPNRLIEKFDILLMGFHKAVMPFSSGDAWQLFLKNGIDTVFSLKQDKLRYSNTMAMIRAIERYPINIITHPGVKIGIDTRLLAKHAAKRNVALEINASYVLRGNPDEYIEYVKLALEEGASFAINSDAHVPHRVGDIEAGIRIAELAGVPVQRIINAE